MRAIAILDKAVERSAQDSVGSGSRAVELVRSLHRLEALVTDVEVQWPMTEGSVMAAPEGEVSDPGINPGID